MLGPDAPAVTPESALAVEFVTGSRIVCVPPTEATVRSYSAVSLVIVDEAARVDDGAYMAIRPMIGVSGGRLLLLSTPAGRRGFFFPACVEQRHDWHVVDLGIRETRIVALQVRDLHRWPLMTE